MSSGSPGTQASGRQSSLANMNAVDIIRKMNNVPSDYSPSSSTSDFTTTFGQPAQEPLWKQHGFGSPEEFEEFVVSNNERVQRYMYHNKVHDHNQPSPKPGLVPSPQPFAQREQYAPLPRNTSTTTKVKKAMSHAAAKMLEKGAKFMDEALLPADHPTGANASPSRHEIQISSPARHDAAWAANIEQATTRHNEGRTLIPIDEAQSVESMRMGWQRANFVQDRDGKVRQRLQSRQEVIDGLENGTVAYVGGSKFDFFADAAANLLGPRDFADKNRHSNFFKGSSEAWRSPEPNLVQPSAAQTSSEAARTLPKVPINHSTVDAKKSTPATQPKVRRQRVVSTWGALIDAGMIDPGQASPERPTTPSSNDDNVIPRAVKTPDARRRRVTVIDSQVFRLADSDDESFDSMRHLNQSSAPSDSEDEAFNFSNQSSQCTQTPETSPEVDATAARLNSINLDGRFAPFEQEDDDDCLTVDTHIRDSHVSWTARYANSDSATVESFHSRQERRDGHQSPVSSERPGDEAARLMARLEEDQKTGRNPRRR